MHRRMGGTAFEPLEERRDKELILGPTMLILLALGLLTMCSFCFVIGYAVGHRGVPAIQAVDAQKSRPTATDIFNSQSKTASQQPAAPASANGGDSAPATDDPSAPSGDEGGTHPAAAPAPVQPALNQPPQPQTTAAPPGRVAPALSNGAVWMVQIAAVSHAEDADVLVGALRKRGYAVTAHREPADGLLHVQVGPFAERNDALAMRQRLLNDGYNAIVEP